MSMTRNHLVLFELYAGGHNGQYVDNLLRYWVEKGLKGRLDILVPRYFLNAYPSIESFVDRHKEQGLGIVEIDDGEIDFTVRGPIKNHYGQLFTFDRVQRRLLIRYLNRIQPDHCLLMNMDHIQPSLAWSLRFPFALKLSGIYFRPSFHYGTFETGASPRLLTQPIDWIKQVRKTWLLKKALKNPHFESLLCLDPFSVPFVKDLAPTVNVVALPDGTSFHDDGTSGPESRANWGIEAGRKVALMFGVINSRKGLFQVLKSLDLLPRSVQQQLALVLTGSISKEERTEALDMITAGRQTSQVQIVVDNRVVEDGEIQGFVRGADFCLVTYQRHVGSSNVLIRSAAEGKPVLGSDFGLVGENIRRHGLGLAIDTTSPECVAEAIRRFVESPESIPFDAGAAVRFARANSAERFAETIFEHTLAR